MDGRLAQRKKLFLSIRLYPLKKVPCDPPRALQFVEIYSKNDCIVRWDLHISSCWLGQLEVDQRRADFNSPHLVYGGNSKLRETTAHSRMKKKILSNLTIRLLSNQLKERRAPAFIEYRTQHSTACKVPRNPGSKILYRPLQPPSLFVRRRGFCEL